MTVMLYSTHEISEALLATARTAHQPQHHSPAAAPAPAPAPLHTHAPPHTHTRARPPPQRRAAPSLPAAPGAHPALPHRPHRARRFDDRVTGKLEAFATHARIVHIDVDPAEIHKNKHAHVPLCADVKPALGLLNKLLEAEPLNPAQ
jgi:hypothetical protein